MKEHLSETDSIDVDASLDKFTPEQKCDIIVRIVEIIFNDDELRHEYFELGQQPSRASRDAKLDPVIEFWRKVEERFNDVDLTLDGASRSRYFVSRSDLTAKKKELIALTFFVIFVCKSQTSSLKLGSTRPTKTRVRSSTKMDCCKRSTSIRRYEESRIKRILRAGIEPTRLLQCVIALPLCNHVVL